MDLNQLLSLIMNLSTLVFVVTSMLAMGLSLSVSQIIAPLCNARLVIRCWRISPCCLSLRS